MLDSPLRPGCGPFQGHRLRFPVQVLLPVLLLASTVAAKSPQATARLCVTATRPTSCATLRHQTLGILSCVPARDRMECLQMIDTKEADIGFFEAEDLAIASSIFRDKYNVIASVKRPDDAGDYGAVLLARTNKQTIKSVCHPGLAFDHFYPPSLTRITSVNGSHHFILTRIQTMIQQASKEYTHACVPGIWSHDPALDRQLKSDNNHLCDACSQGACGATDDYAGTAGTVACLLDRAADAAWTSDVEALKMAAEHPHAEFEYVCPDQTRQNLSTKTPCTWGRRPKPVLLGPPCDEHQCSILMGTINTLMEKSELVTSVLGLPLGTHLVRPESGRTSPSTVLSEAGQHTSLFESQDPSVRICVRDALEKDKCMRLAWSGLAFGVDRGVTCVLADSTAKCIELIYQRAADTIALDGSEVHDVKRNYDFERILSEVYDSGDHTATSSYYAVAVVRKHSDIKSFAQLVGKKSCHTGIGKTSGWKMPVAELIDQHLIKPQHCDFVSAVAEFFSGGSCLPGTKLEKYNPELSHVDTLCKLCIGGCARGSEEPFYSYTGAFRCLAHGGGDVAFVKHTTVPDNTGGKRPEAWALGLNEDDFELLCPSGGRAAIREYKNCNLALVPAHEVVVRQGLPDSRKSAIRHVLLTLAAMFKDGAKPSRTFKLFGKYNGVPDLLFKDSSKGLRSLEEDTPSEVRLKDNYFRKLDDLHACEVRVCALVGEETDCERMAAAMHRHGQTVTCVSARDRLDCVKKVSHGQADVTPIPGNYLSLYDNLRVIAFLKKPEDYNLDFRYEAVAVVRKSTVHMFEDLKGRKSCHTGYGRTTGWRIPMALLKRAGVLETPCTNGESSLAQEIEALAVTFNRACVPGNWSTTESLDTALKKRFKAMCSMCQSRTCDASDEFAGYEGALMCLTENNGDIAFSKLSVAQAYFKQTNARAVRTSDYGLLCPDNKVVDIVSAEAKECIWAGRPWDVYAANAGISELKMGILKDFVKTAKFVAEKESVTSTWYYTSLGLSFAFRDIATTRTNITSAEYHSQSRMDVVAKERVCPQRPIKMCVRSEEENEKCMDLSSTLAAYGVSPDLSCVQARDTPTCIVHVAMGQADVIALDGGDFYTASTNHDLQALLTEVYGEHKNRYYAVAVVRNDSGINSLQDLKGKNSCHTGIEKNTGWRMPIATLKQAGLISRRSCDFPTEIGKFFKASCVPGAKHPLYDPYGTNPDSLCELCVGESYKVAVTGLLQVVPKEGDEMHKCERNNRELFYSYTGAFRCLVQGGGDVAFVKHTTVLDNTDGNNKDPWASRLNSTDYRLLCINGTAEPKDYRQCNLAEVPAHVVVTRKAEYDTRKEDMRHVLLKANSYFGKKNSFFVLYGSYFERSDLLFKDSTTDLDLTSHEQYKEYFDKLHELEQCVNVG